jgi:hypothetical protein
MLNNWFYSHPTWMVGLAICGVLVVIALGGLALFHRWVNWHNREHDTSMTGLSYALAGGIYAVVLAFVAVGVYQSMDKSQGLAIEEANGLSALAFDSAGLPDEAGKKLRENVDK